MEKKDEDKLIMRIEDLVNKSFSFNGIHLLSGDASCEGNFFGFSVGAAKPTTIKIVSASNNIQLNGATLTENDNIADFVSEGEFVPVEFTKMTITGSGKIKNYKKW
jgi:hypothetical protein